LPALRSAIRGEPAPALGTCRIALIFTARNAMVLAIRIRVEDAALRQRRGLARRGPEGDHH
jgi:hypothetical protein